MQGQSKQHSFMESMTNTLLGVLIGFTISQLAHHYESWIQIHLWSDFKWELSVASNVVMTIIITTASLIRGYVLRRFFNKLGNRNEDVSR